jgi:hypothetical protein
MFDPILTLPNFFLPIFFLEKLCSVFVYIIDPMKSFSLSQFLAGILETQDRIHNESSAIFSQGPNSS